MNHDVAKVRTFATESSRGLYLEPGSMAPALLLFTLLCPAQAHFYFASLCLTTMPNPELCNLEVQWSCLLCLPHRSAQPQGYASLKCGGHVYQSLPCTSVKTLCWGNVTLKCAGYVYQSPPHRFAWTWYYIMAPCLAVLMGRVVCAR